MSVPQPPTLVQPSGETRVSAVMATGQPRAALQQTYMRKDIDALLADWDTPSAPPIVRNAIITAMSAKKAFPQQWTDEREKTVGLYPDIYDPQFSAKLYAKREFYDAKAVAFSALAEKGDQCSLQAFETFDLTPTQRLVSRFMHPSTPYLGCLLYHGVGVGKTCSAVTISENFLQDRPGSRVHLVVPRSIAPGFRRTIFDPERLRRTRTGDEARYVSHGWYSAQCSGTTYLDLVSATAGEEKNRILYRIQQQIRHRYHISGYMAFKLSIDALFNKEIPAHITGPERTLRENEIIRKTFSDGLIIIDEAHNLRQDPDVMTAEEIAPDENPDVDAASEALEAKAIIPYLLRILENTEGLRLVLMTATPMFNTAPEILFLLNLLVLNDTKRTASLLKSDDIFTKSGMLTEVGAEKIQEVANRYVSYMRGENPYTFPVRLHPAETEEWDIMNEYPLRTALRGGRDLTILPEVRRGIGALPIIRVRPNESSICATTLRFQMRAPLTSETREDSPLEIGIRKNVLDSWTQIGNFTYPNGQFGRTGWDTHFKEEGKQFTWRPENEYDIDAAFGPDNLDSHGPKFDKIIKTIRTSRGINFVFSRFVQPGSLAFCIALERAGFTRVNSEGSPLPLLKNIQRVPRQCAFCENKENAHNDSDHSFGPANYVLLTSDYTPDFPGTLKYISDLQDERSVRGGKVKVIVGSLVASEGLDLKCVREVHILDPWYHLNRIEQIIGRGVRYCSHSRLPAEERNCLIRLYALYLDDVETSDLYCYRIAVQKAKVIGLVQRELKKGAWDCNLNIEGILLSGGIRQDHMDAQGRNLPQLHLEDQPFTNLCDYMECSYSCRISTPSISESGEDLNLSTYSSRDARYIFLMREKSLRQLFEQSPFWPLSAVRSLYSDLPDEVISDGLTSVLNNPDFLVHFRGAPGYLIVRNGYVLFQPSGVSDTSIPMSLRYHRAAEAGEGMTLFATSIRPTKGPFARIGVNIRVPEIVQGRIEVEEISEQPGATPPSAPVLAITATRTLAEDLNIWIKQVDSLLSASKQQVLTLPPEMSRRLKGIEEIGLLAWRFRSLPEVRTVLLSMGLDHLYNTEVRNQLLIDYLAKENLELPNVFETTIKKEIFTGETLRGYFFANVRVPALEIYCSLTGLPPYATCPSSLLKYAESGGEKKIKVVTDCGDLFGFLTPKVPHLTFKTVENTPAGPSTEGAECSGVSNKDPHLRRLRILTASVKKYSDMELADLLIPDSPEKSKTAGANIGVQRQAPKKGDIALTGDIKQYVLCIYLEFLCRLMDARKVGNKRWFMNLVEWYRSDMKSEMKRKA